MNINFTQTQRILAPVFAALALLVSCGNPLATDAGTAAATAATTGSLTLEFPAIVHAAPPPSSKPQAGLSRALGLTSNYTGYRLTIQTAAGVDVVPPKTATSFTTSLTIPLIPPGTNYTVAIQIYNSSMSATEPILAGSKTGVTVSAGASTSVTLTCLPVSTTSLMVNGSVATVQLAGGAESWFAVNLVSGVHYYISQSNVEFATKAFNATGLTLSSDGNQADFVAAYTGLMYLVVGNRTTDQAGTGALSVKTAGATLREGAAGSAVALTLNADHAFVSGPANNSLNSSYYQFTTAQAGSYVLNLVGSYSLDVYSNNLFTAQLGSRYYPNYSDGVTLAGLAAATTYYLKLTNADSMNTMTVTGQILDPAFIVAHAHHEGSIAAPVALGLGAERAAVVGCQTFDRQSYYSFTTGSSVDYVLNAYQLATGGNQVNGTLYAVADFSTGYIQDVSLGEGSAIKLTLSANTTYYLLLNGQYSQDLPYFGLKLRIDQITPPSSFISVPADGLRFDQSITTPGGSVWYSATVEAGKTYKVYLYDSDYSDNGVRSYTMDCRVSGYQADRSTRYFLREDSPNSDSSAKVVVIPAGQTRLYLLVESYSYGRGTGSFALRVQVQ